MGKTRVSVENLRFDPSINLKTINGQNIYGSGDICIQSGAIGVPLGAAYDSTSYAYGYNTTTNNSYSLALGKNSQTFGCYSVAIGLQTCATNDISAAVGYNTDALGTSSTAVGTNTHACGDMSVAFGSSITSRADSVIFGYGTMLDMTSRYDVILGSRNCTTAGTTNTIMVGSCNAIHSTCCNTNYNLLFGQCNCTYDSSNHMYGSDNKGCLYNNRLYGSSNYAAGHSNDLYGSSNTAYGNLGVALGSTNTVDTSSIALGICNNTAWGGLSIGRWNNVSSNLGINVGISNRSNDSKCMIILGAGMDVESSSNPYKIMIGYDKTVSYSAFRTGNPTVTTVPAIGVLEDDTTVLKGLKIAANAGANKVLTSDANGVASWQAPSSGGSAIYIQETEPVVAIGQKALWIQKMPDGTFDFKIIEN